MKERKNGRKELGLLARTCPLGREAGIKLSGLLSVSLRVPICKQGWER
jgi:hypothetical protein